VACWSARARERDAPPRVPSSSKLAEEDKEECEADDRARDHAHGVVNEHIAPEGASVVVLPLGALTAFTETKMT
jgi:hypothetical protein